MDPGDPMLYCRRGRAYLGRREYGLAARDCDKAIEVYGDKPFVRFKDKGAAYRVRARAYAAKGEYDKAAQEYTKLIEE